MNYRKVIFLIVALGLLLSLAILVFGQATGLFTLNSSLIKSKPTINQNIVNYKPDYSKVINNNIIKLTPQQVLDYNSMSDVKHTLQNMIINNVNGGGTITAYNIVLMLLNNGYNGYTTNEWKELFFTTNLSKYSLGPNLPNFTGLYYERNYIILVTHSLWVEINCVVPWSLKDYTKEDINNLYWIQGLNNQVIPSISINSNQISSEQDHFPTESTVTELFLIANKFKKTNQLDTIYELIKWEEKNFFHAYTDYGWNKYRDGRTDDKASVIYNDGSLKFDPISLKRIFDERIIGCHEPVLIFKDLLRSLNIPAVNISFSGHGVTYLPTIQKYIHGDYFADFAVVPPEDLLLTKDEAKIVVNSENYDKPIMDKYKINFFVPNIELKRENNKLYLSTNTYCWNMSNIVNALDDWNKISLQAKDYNLNYIQKDCNIYSNKLPIKTLSELSGCFTDSDCLNNEFCSKTTKVCQQCYQRGTIFEPPFTNKACCSGLTPYKIFSAQYITKYACLTQEDINKYQTQ